MLEGVQHNTHCDLIIVGARFSYYAHGHYQPCLHFTVRLDRLSERGATCSLVQKGLQQFSPNNALVLGGVIIN